MFLFKKKKKEDKTTKVEEKPVEETKKAQPKKVEAKPAAAKEEKATTKKDTKSVYHVSKREEDGMWQVKYTGGRVIKLCKTKEEAMAYAKQMASNQEGTVIFHPSKGQNKGKFQKAK